MKKRKMTKEEIREYLLRSRELLEGDLLWEDEETEPEVIQTPAYWQNEEYQPLVEVETAYGNKVRIPERWLASLEGLKMGRSQQDLVDTLKYGIEKGNRGHQANDFARVLLEIYQPQTMTEEKKQFSESEKEPARKNLELLKSTPLKPSTHSEKYGGMDIMEHFSYSRRSYSGKRKMTDEEVRRQRRLSREMLEGDRLWEDEEELFIRASEILFGTASDEDGE